jgi:hypothetical protein
MTSTVVNPNVYESHRVPGTRYTISIFTDVAMVETGKPGSPREEMVIWTCHVSWGYNETLIDGMWSSEATVRKYANEKWAEIVRDRNNGDQCRLVKEWYKKHPQD